MGFVVLTTVQSPTPSVQALAAAGGRAGFTLLAVGDRKTPAASWPEGAELFTIEQQLDSPLRLAGLLPENHYARKNLGYLAAIARGARSIFDTDDDNAPLGSWGPREQRTQARACPSTGWVNVYRYFSTESIWPRGFPLDRVRAVAAPTDVQDTITVDAPIQQSLVDGSPDVDAVWRLVLGRPFVFDRAPSVWLPPGAWCPFNSQATWWFPEAYPLLYLPSFVSFRMTDIWRSLVAQRCLWELGQGLVFHSPDMFQERNAHDLLRDFELELPGYLGNGRISSLLERTTLAGGLGAVGANLHRCYAALVGAGLVPQAEMPVAEAWLSDLEISQSVTRPNLSS